MSTAVSSTVAATAARRQDGATKWSTLRARLWVRREGVWLLPWENLQERISAPGGPPVVRAGTGPHQRLRLRMAL